MRLQTKKTKENGNKHTNPSILSLRHNSSTSNDGNSPYHVEVDDAVQVQNVRSDAAELIDVVAEFLEGVLLR